MFKKGDYVVCGKNGVCQVLDIDTPDFLWADRGKKYYVLQPVYMPSGRVYIPVEQNRVVMRRALGRKEVDALIASIPDIELIPITNEKTCEEKYRECLYKNECREWVRILKTTYARRRRRNQDGRKITSIDYKYQKLAEENLYGEFALALGIERDRVEDYIADQIKK